MKRTASMLATLAGGLLSLDATAATVVFMGFDNVDLSAGGANPASAAAAAAFAGAAGSLAVQDFEGFTPGAPPASFAIGGVTATLTDTATDTTQITAGVGGFSTYATSGNQFLDSLTLDDSAFFTITFDAPVRGFGFYLSDPSDWAGIAGTANLVLRVTQQGGVQDVVLFGDTPASQMVNGGLGYVGLLDDDNPFLSFTLLNPGANPDEDAIGLDDLAVTAVPLPAGAFLFAPALALLGLARRRS